MHKEIVRILDKILFLYSTDCCDFQDFAAGIGFGNTVIEIEKRPNGKLYAWLWKNVVKTEGYSVCVFREKYDFIPKIEFRRHDYNDQED